MGLHSVNVYTFQDARSVGSTSMKMTMASRRCYIAGLAWIGFSLFGKVESSVVEPEICGKTR